jgi:aspartyl-tRNA synthetase
MIRTQIKDIKGQLGQKVKVSGFAETIRKQGGIIFLVLRDITGSIQTVVIKGNTENFEKIANLSLESVISIEGDAKKNAQAPNGIEIFIDSVEVLSVAEPELPIPVNEKGEGETNLDTRLDWRYLDLRKEKNALIFKVWTLMDQVFTNVLTDKGFIQIHTPKTTASPSEGGAELFEINYFDRKGYLTQSPQFYKQMGMSAGLEKVFEIGPVFRADPSFTSRHNTEFTGYDLEMSFIESHHEVMDLEEIVLTEIVKKIKEVYGEEIFRVFNRELIVPTSPFPRLKFSEVKEILKKQGITSDKAADLSPEEEKGIGEYAKINHNSEFVFIIDYPTVGRAFYSQKYEDDPKTSKTFDLLWNGLEITSGAKREHRYEELRQNALDKGINLETIQDYLNFFKYGCPPHGGLGAGPNRFIMKLLGLDNIREATYLYRGVKRLTP